MIINQEDSLIVCFSELAVQDNKVILYKNANSLYLYILII